LVDLREKRGIVRLDHSPFFNRTCFDQHVHFKVRPQSNPREALGFLEEAEFIHIPLTSYKVTIKSPSAMLGPGPSETLVREPILFDADNRCESSTGPVLAGEASYRKAPYDPRAILLVNEFAHFGQPLFPRGRGTERKKAGWQATTSAMCGSPRWRSDRRPPTEVSPAEALALVVWHQSFVRDRPG
jgi:hypothetical protein